MEDQCLAERVIQPANFDELNPENVEEKIKNLGLFEDDYVSDDDTKVCRFFFKFKLIVKIKNINVVLYFLLGRVNGCFKKKKNGGIQWNIFWFLWNEELYTGFPKLTLLKIYGNSFNLKVT